MRLVLGCLFLFLAAVIFSRPLFAPDLDKKFNPVRLNLGGVFAVVFGLVNIARWYVAWSYRRSLATPVRTPLQPDPDAPRTGERNPELDFTREETKN